MDPCVLRLLPDNKVTAMRVIHEDDIVFAGVCDVCDIIMDTLIDKLATKFRELSWYMGSKYIRNEKAGTLEVSQPQFSQNVINRFNDKSKPYPCFSAIGPMAVDEEEVVADMPLREVMESLMWIANQTRPNIANAVPPVARYSRDPKEIHKKAACKILAILKATAELGLTFCRENDLDVGVVFYF